MSETVNITPIARLKSPLSQKFGVPRQPNLVDIPCEIHLLPPYNHEDAVAGLTQFSHLWVVWQFHHIADTRFRPLVRPPRLGGNTKIGVFASRSMFRPNNIGLSVVKLLSVETQNKQVILKISGADMVDGTPIFDIKPYISYSDAKPEAVSGYAIEKPQKTDVIWLTHANDAFANAIKSALEIIDNDINHLQANDKNIITQLIALDPRPAYKKQPTNEPVNPQQKTYTMRFKNYDIVFYAEGNCFKIADVKTVSVE